MVLEAVQLSQTELHQPILTMLPAAQGDHHHHHIIMIIRIMIIMIIILLAILSW